MSIAEDWWVTPKRRLRSIPENPTLDEKIDIFSERINGWKIDIADQLINGRVIQNEKGNVIIEGNPHAAYATMDIILSYFEMIAKYQDGYVNTKEGKSRVYFKKGFCSVFAEEVENIKEEKMRSIFEKLLDTLYDGARCGMYHIGLTDSRIFLAGGAAPPIKFDSIGRITLNPHTLVKLISIHFNNYIKQLKDPSNTSLRSNFERRFDLDTSGNARRSTSKK
jgi:hypothetical protein